MKKYLTIASLLVLFIIAAGCAKGTDPIVQLITDTFTPSPTSIVTATATVMPSAQATVDPTLTFTPIYTDTSTNTPAPTATQTITPAPTATDTIAPTATATQIPVAKLKKWENIKSGPGDYYYSIYPYPPETEFVVLGKSVDQKWLQIKLLEYQNKGTGWAPVASFYDIDIRDLTVFLDPPTPIPNAITPTIDDKGKTPVAPSRTPPTPPTQ